MNNIDNKNSIFKNVTPRKIEDVKRAEQLTEAANAFNAKYNLNIKRSSFKKVNIEIEDYVSVEIKDKTRSYSMQVMSRFFKKPVILFSIITFIAVVVAGYVFGRMELLGKNNNLGFGVDAYGNNFWTQTWKGLSHTIEIGVIVAISSSIVGTVIGSWLGTKVGSKTDMAFMKFLFVFNAVPAFMWYLMILFLMPESHWSLVTALALTSWTRSLNSSRTQMWRCINTDYFEAAEVMGVKRWKVIFKHALPNYSSYIWIILIQTISGALISEVVASVLGLAGTTDSYVTLGTVFRHAMYEFGGTWDTTAQLLLVSAVILTMTFVLYLIAININKVFNPNSNGGN